MKITNVMIAGGGTLGSQIAWQTAFNGFKVIVYDAFDEGLKRSKNFHNQFASLFLKERGAGQSEIEETFDRLSYTTNLTNAVNDVDLIIEAVPENFEIKKGFYTKLASVAPVKTIFTTNSSTLLPSDFAALTGRPDKFLALHFANNIWDANVGEVMGHEGTDPKIFDRVVKFASEIGMVPIPIYKEQNGYILNSLLVPFLDAAGDLLVNDVATPESIDKCWSISMGRTTIGPCAIMDIIGMRTIYQISMLWAEKTNSEAHLKRAQYIKENFIDKGKFGVESGEGFYKYPNPIYQEPDFLK
ncbi:3-hydroxyacyl-CoA dehydrogenase [Lutimonas zeaxanthinifaciens]|uniref:3-hydroxyacyl-CoA dehydrogenase n=1 Tax=Lutimonas zeaxanthinifaciens TaxID=3060215 RepID=UPI00265C94DD|nr:3-hydroxyacyl-CoA dehydrogenase [Lutimonas sp. YSD2104]WKK65745.1 3-hydroxyacyl-CoA dehydrogenase [Lutimonas sp. YSD2104]